MFNRGESTFKMTLTLSTYGMTGPLHVRDLWEHKDLGVVQDSFTADVPSHGVVFLKVSK
jgi:alpha-galactosidase